VRFVDLNKQPWSADANFVDTVHLKPEMSTSFLNELAVQATDSSVLVAMAKTATPYKSRP
jgi:hypothetical protein